MNIDVVILIPKYIIVITRYVIVITFIYYRSNCRSRPLLASPSSQAGVLMAYLMTVEEEVVEGACSIVELEASAGVEAEGLVFRAFGKIAGLLFLSEEEPL